MIDTEELTLPSGIVQKGLDLTAGSPARTNHKALVLAKGYLPAEVNAGDSDVGVHVLKFPLGDIDNFKLCRAAVALGRQKAGESVRASWGRYAPWERAWLEALAGVSLKSTEFKAMGDQVSGIDGGFLAPELWSQKLFGLLRSFSAIDQLPVTRLTVPYRVTHLPRITGDISVVYPGENTAITASQFKAGQLSYTAHKASALIYLSNELVMDAPDFYDQYLQSEGAAALATDRDTQLFTGNGSVGPTGLVNMPSVQTYYMTSSAGATLTKIVGSAFAAQPSYIGLGALINNIENLNGSTTVTTGQAECTGMVVHSQFKQTVIASANFQDTQKRPLWFQGLNQNGGLFGMDWAMSNVIPNTQNVGSGASNNTSLIIGGWWQKYVLVECLTLGFDASAETGTASTGFAADQTAVRLIHRYDGSPSHAEAFAILSGVLV